MCAFAALREPCEYSGCFQLMQQRQSAKSRERGCELEVLKINGQEKEFPDGIPATLAELLDKLDISQATVVAQIDGQIVQRKAFAQSKLLAGQSIELVRVMGGG